MPFPRLGWFGSAETGRGGRRRSVRAQRRTRGEGATTPQKDPKVMAEQRKRRIGIGVGAAFIFVVIGVVAFGYYQEFYRPPRVWAGSVNNVTFSMGDLVQRIRVLQGERRYQGGRVDLSTVPFEYLQDLIHAEILRQEAPGLGINITDADVDQELRRRFAPTAAAGQETDPGQLESEFNDVYLSFLTATGLSNGDYRVRIKEDLSEFALMGIFSQELEDPQQQVEIQWIQLSENTNFLPRDVTKRLENEDFTRVAQELNTPSQFSGSDGYVGWVPKGAFPGLDDIFFGNEEDEIAPQEPGTVSEPVFTNEGFFLVKVLSGVEERALTEIMAFKVLQESVKKWQLETLQSGTSNGTIKMKFNSVLYAWVADQVAVTAPRIDRPTPVPQLLPGLGG